MEEPKLTTPAFSLTTLELLEPALAFAQDSVISTTSENVVRFETTHSSNPTRSNANASQSKRKASRSKSPARFSLEEASSKEAVKSSSSFGKLIDCRNKAAGCTERVPKGTLVEREHHQNCRFRPIPCLMQQTCSELVPYHNFLLHHMQHFLAPIFSANLTTTVYFNQEDFQRNQRWNPRWINCYGKDFFILVSHKIPGMWYVWVWMLGTSEEADAFSYDVEISNGDRHKSGTFNVLSIRTTMDEIERSESCLATTDIQIKRISQINENCVGCFTLDLVIYKNKGSENSLRSGLQNNVS